MNAVLWICQGFLAVLFAVSGGAKVSMSKERMLATGQTGVEPFPLPLIRLVAVCELLGVVGVILPWATGIAPSLTPLAALGFCVVMVGAATSHAQIAMRQRSRREAGVVAFNIVVLLVAALVALGRMV